MNFITGGVAGMTATSIIQPLDMVKTRMQLSSEGLAARPSVTSIIRNLFVNEGGIKAFYKGIGSALMRQMVYSGLRLGIFYTILDASKEKLGRNLTATEKALTSLGSGGVSAFIATPFDLALVRFQADGVLPADQRRNYRSWANALGSIIKNEGFFKMWKGAFPTIVRAMSMNLGMLAPYEECKQRLRKYLGDGYLTYISSSFVAGFLAAFLGLPFDNMKTKIQKMKPDRDGKLPYKGLLNCARKTLRNEGALRFWVGFPVFYVRVGIHAMITLLVTDALKFTILGKK